MYNVHKFMDLNPYEVGYFIEQVANAGASFGVTQSDLGAVGMALENLFDVRCGQPMTVIPSQGAQLQSICIDGACPLPMDPACAKYAPVTVPINKSTGMASSAPGSTGNSGTQPGTCTPQPGAAVHYGQCGGEAWTGPVECEGSYTCTMFNPYYSQCL